MTTSTTAALIKAAREAWRVMDVMCPNENETDALMEALLAIEQQPTGGGEDGWQEFTIRVKDDPKWPHHGTDIEFNGVRYVRQDLSPTQPPAPQTEGK